MDNTKTWAHFRLGLVSLQMNNVYNAVKAFKIVSRRPPVSGQKKSLVLFVLFLYNKVLVGQHWMMHIYIQII